MAVDPEAVERGRVLVVEDDESAATYVTRVLDRAGFDSSWAIDADQASTMLADLEFDVLLTDFRLPGRNGLELVREVRGWQPRLSIAVMTSFNESDLERVARSVGADDFFEKPLPPTALVTRITALLTKRRAWGGRDEASRLSEKAGGCDSGGEGGGGAEGKGEGEGGSGGSGGGGRGRGRAGAGGGGGGCLFTAIATGGSLPGSVRRVDPWQAAPASDLPLPGCEERGVDWSEGPKPDIGSFARSERPRALVALWASTAPVASRVASRTGPVTSPRTSASWA